MCKIPSTEEEVFGSATPEASFLDEDPNGLAKLTKTDAKTCCPEKNIVVATRNEELDNYCQDHDNYR